MLYETFIFFLIAAHCTLPGWLALGLLTDHTRTFIEGVAISLSFLFLSQMIFALLGVPTKWWLIFYYLSILSLALIQAIRLFRLKTRVHLVGSSKATASSRLIFILMAVLYSGYFLLVGPYTEIPSDYWQHIARVQAEILRIRDIGLNAPGIDSMAELLAYRPFYFLMGLAASVTNLDALAISAPVSLLFSLIFLAALYSFCLYLSRASFHTPNVQILAAACGTVFTCLWLGTATLAYIRYYAFAPGILGMALMFPSLALFLKFLSGEIGVRRFAALAAPVALTIMFIHIQELLFLIVLTSFISVLAFIKACIRKENCETDTFGRLRILAGVSILFLALFFTLGPVLLDQKPWGYTPHTIDIGAIFGLSSKIPLVSATFRPWDTIGYFGIIVLIWYLVERRHFENSVFITASVFVPILTCFNPFFISAFLFYASSTVAWRFMYLMPLGIIFGFLIAKTYQSFKARGPDWRNVARGAVGVTAMLSLLPLPILNEPNRTSRLSSFANVHSASGAAYYQDLFDETESLTRLHNIRGILTDSVTGFVLYASLRGEIRHWLKEEYFPANNVNFEHDLLTSDFTRHLLIINRRDGKLTQNATLAGHWTADTLLTSQYYPEQLLGFVRVHPEKFRLLWEHDEISIYLVLPKPA